MKSALAHLSSRFPEEVTATRSSPQGDDSATVQAAALQEVARFCKLEKELDSKAIPLALCRGPTALAGTLSALRARLSLAPGAGALEVAPFESARLRDAARGSFGSTYLEGRRLVGALYLRLLWNPLCRPPGLEADSPLRGIHRPPVAQGLPGPQAPTAGARARGLGARARSGRRTSASGEPGMKVAAPFDLDPLAAPVEGGRMTVNLGPSHPAMHGTVRIVLELEGETIVKATPRSASCTAASRRSASAPPGSSASPTSTAQLRLAAAQQRRLPLGGGEAPRRSPPRRAPSTSASSRGELHRICDHLTLVGALGLELGAFTVFLYGAGSPRARSGIA